METGIKDGAYVIQEQGDLGLGTTKIDPKHVKKEGKLEGTVEIPKECRVEISFGKNEN